MVDFEKMKKLYELVKDGTMKKAEGENFVIYSMGESNPVVRIDIKEGK